MPKVLIVQPIDRKGIELLLEAGLTIKQLDPPDMVTLQQEVVDADAILVRNAEIPRAIIEKAEKLKVISRHGAGLETIDIGTATKRGVYVTHTPVANSVSVAEHVIGMMLGLSKNLLRVDQELRKTGRFEIREQCTGYQLEGRVLGILGLGNIGRRLAKKASLGLGMRVVAYDPFVEKHSLETRIDVFNDPASVFREADFVSLHLPLNEYTKHSVGMTQFKQMKPSAFFINCSRGAIVKESELIKALEQGFIAGAGIDVFDPYLPGKDHPLLSMKNVIVTPHSAAFTREALENMAIQSAQGIIDVLNNRPPQWLANRDVKNRKES